MSDSALTRTVSTPSGNLKVLIYIHRNCLLHTHKQTKKQTTRVKWVKVRVEKSVVDLSKVGWSESGVN